MRKLKTLFALLVLFFFTIGNVWGTVLFHETFGEGSTSSTQTWSHSNGSQTGVDAVMANDGLTSSATNAKQSKQSDANNYTSGAGASLMGNAGSNTSAVTAVYIVGPLVTTNCSEMVVSFAVKYGSVGASYFSNLYYSTDNSTWSAVTTTGGPSTANTWGLKTSTSTIPAASTIWFKIEYSLGLKGGNPYIDEFDLSGTYSASSDPAVLFEQSGSEIDTLDFGTYKQYENDTEGPLELAVASLTLKQANFTAEANVTVYTNGSGLSVSQNVITPLDWDENGEKEITVYASTAYAGSFIGKTTGEDKTYFLYAQSATDEFENDTLPLKLIVTARNRIWVETEDANKGTATIDGGSIAYSETGSEVLNLVASPKPGYVFKNWTVDEDNIVIDDEDAASTTASTIIGEATITAHFEAQTCIGLAAPTLNKLTKSYDYANLKWTEVTNADNYRVIVVKHEGSVPYINLLTPDLETEMLTVEANTQYDYTVMAVGDGTTYCDENNPLLEGSFTTDDYPAATLTLRANGDTPYNLAGEHKLMDVVTLPSEVADSSKVVGKVLVGWDTNENCATAPTYAKGASFTLTATSQTLYAVYAIEGATTFTKLASSSFETTAVYVIAGDKASDDATLYYFNSCAKTDEGNTWGGATASTTGLIEFKLSGEADSLVAQEVSGNKRYLKGLTTANFQMSASAQKLTLSSEGKIGSENGYTLRHNYNSGSGGFRWYASSNKTLPNAFFYKKETAYSAYATTGDKAPSATVSTEINIEAAAVADGSIAVTYKNVTLANVKVATYSDAACAAKDTLNAGWLVAGLDGDKNITYTASANASYTTTQKAYIQLVAPNASASDTVVITVTQAVKPAVFSSLAELVSELGSNEMNGVTVTLTNMAIDSISANNKGLFVGVIAPNDKKIQLYNSSTEKPAAWVVGGKLTGVVTGDWTHYVKNTTDWWELMLTDWSVFEYTKAPAGLAWSSNAASVVINAVDNEYPTLTNAHSLDVTYSSSDATIASFADESVYDITLYENKEGSVTISAIFAGNDSYAAQTVTYTLTVSKTTTGVDNTDAEVKAVKVLRDGQIYILRGEKVYTIQGQLVK